MPAFATLCALRFARPIAEPIVSAACFNNLFFFAICLLHVKREPSYTSCNRSSIGIGCRFLARGFLLCGTFFVEILHKDNFVLGFVVEEIVHIRFREQQSESSRTQTFLLSHLIVFGGLIGSMTDCRV